MPAASALRRAVSSRRRGPTLALAASLAWCAALVAAPLSLPPATVAGLDGRENVEDHLDLWRELPLLPALVYGVGDFLCHQKHWRSLHVHGNQLPIDERMTAIFFAASAGLALSLRARPDLYVSRGVASLLPARWRNAPRLADPRRAVVWTSAGVVLLLLPAAVDVAVENVFARESTRAARLVTGALAGVVGGVVLGCALTAGDLFLREALRLHRRGGLLRVKP